MSVLKNESQIELCNLFGIGGDLSLHCLKSLECRARLTFGCAVAGILTSVQF